MSQTDIESSQIPSESLQEIIHCCCVRYVLRPNSFFI